MGVLVIVLGIRWAARIRSSRRCCPAERSSIACRCALETVLVCHRASAHHDFSADAPVAGVSRLPAGTTAPVTELWRVLAQMPLPMRAITPLAISSFRAAVTLLAAFSIPNPLLHELRQQQKRLFALVWRHGCQLGLESVQRWVWGGWAGWLGGHWGHGRFFTSCPQARGWRFGGFGMP